MAAAAAARIAVIAAYDAQGSGIEQDAFVAPQEVLDWTTEETLHWLKKEGFADVQSKFERYRIDGSSLFELTHKHMIQMGITRVGVRKKLMFLIESLQQKKTRTQGTTLSVPSWPKSYLELFTFKWAQTSAGKRGYEQKEELTSANLCVSIVAALMTGTCLSGSWYAPRVVSAVLIQWMGHMMGFTREMMRRVGVRKVMI